MNTKPRDTDAENSIIRAAAESIHVYIWRAYSSLSAADSELLEGRVW
jgi:hypothetical protein